MCVGGRFVAIIISRSSRYDIYVKIDCILLYLGYIDEFRTLQIVVAHVVQDTETILTLLCVWGGVLCGVGG